MQKTLTGRPGFLWGITVHNRGYEAYPEKHLEEHICLCRELGLNLVRFNFNPISDGDYAYLDRVVELCRQNGMQVMLVLDSVFHLENPDDFEGYHGAIARRYKGKIRYYQLFNETDNYCMYKDDGTLYKDDNGKVMDAYNPEHLDQIVPRLLASVRGFRANDPDARLIVNFCWWHTAIIDYYMEHGIQWDIMGWDWYSDAENKSSIRDVFDYIGEKYPDYDMMIGEGNINAWVPYSEEEQADYVAKFVEAVYTHPSPRVIGASLYELLDEPAFERNKDYDGESHYGFVHCSAAGDIGEPKPVYKRLQVLIRPSVEGG